MGRPILGRPLPLERVMSPKRLIALFAVVATLFAVPSAFAQGRGRGGGHRGHHDVPAQVHDDPGEQAERQLRRLERELAAMEDLIAQMRSERLADELSNRVRRARNITRNLDGEIAALSQPVVIVDRGRPAHPRGPQATSEADFQRVLSHIDRQHFDDEKLAILREAAPGRLFTAQQVARVVQEMTFSDAKVEAAVLLYDHTLNQYDFFVVYDAFVFSSDKQEVRRRIHG